MSIDRKGRGNGSLNKYPKYSLKNKETGQVSLFKSLNELCDFFKCSEPCIRQQIKDRNEGKFHNSRVGKLFRKYEFYIIPLDERIYNKPLGNIYNKELYYSNKNKYIEYYEKYLK